MEATIFTAVVGLVGLVALWIGTDSRDGFSSKEHELARSGLTWADLRAEQESRREQKDQGTLR